VKKSKTEPLVFIPSIDLLITPCSNELSGAHRSGPNPYLAITVPKHLAYSIHLESAGIRVRPEERTEARRSEARVSMHPSVSQSS